MNTLGKGVVYNSEMFVTHIVLWIYNVIMYSLKSIECVLILWVKLQKIEEEYNFWFVYV